MYLEGLTLSGFKSFVDPTKIPVRGNMNAVVGPNGCGKSNIVDAIRWVIGETSAKQLRGQSMTDVIFNGTTARKPVGKAMVELTFNNQDGSAGGEYAKYAHIAIRRELSRDGQSSYFINGSQCRRRDIIDIFLGTGLGRYAIIEQGVVSQLIEAKPEEFRVYLEEAAGISKYKDRRRETENRMRRTEENLSRIKDLCDELEKQLRHLKRQANSAERYKELRDEERQIQSQIKGLQWQTLQAQLAQFEERIAETNLALEAQQTDYQEIQTKTEKTRLDQQEAVDQQNEVQKGYYALGAEIARIEQRIKDTQEQTQRWRDELEEAEMLWQELTESTTEHQDQIQELNQEVNELSPQQETIKQVAEQAQQALQRAERDMNACQERWENHQSKLSDVLRRSEVAKTNLSHYQQQLSSLEQRQQQLLQRNDTTDLVSLEQELSPIEARSEEMSERLTVIQSRLNELREKIIAQRQQNQQENNALNQSRRDLQTDEARYASLQALQKTALSGDERSTTWLGQHQLTEAKRFGKTLRVNSGWELAVETVLGHYFEGVCVEDSNAYIESLHADQTAVTLIDRHQASSSASRSEGRVSLADQIESDWSRVSWLEDVFVANSLEEAKSIRSTLASHQSVITQNGLWMGVNWIRRAKASDREQGVLARERELSELNETIQLKQVQVERLQQTAKENEEILSTLEKERDEQHRTYQSLSQEITQIKAEFSAKRSRYDALQQQASRVQEELERTREQIQRSQSARHEVEQQFQQAEQQHSQESRQRDEILHQRDHHREILQTARATAQREQQKADELEIRLSSSESQLGVLRQTVARAERQMQQLEEKRERLTDQLAENDGPLASLQQELQALLNNRLSVETKLREAEANVEQQNEQLRDHDTQRDRLQSAMNKTKEALQSFQMEAQGLKVRQATIQEQLAETDLQIEQILESLPAEASMSEWSGRAESIAQKINRLGPINLAAIEEYDQVNERKNYLDKQQADLHEALEVLQDAIRKIDRETRQKFKDTYDKVNEGFKSLFPRVFGGGSASLELEEDDLLTSGVIIRAQPPGKRNSTIHMLSGGEKALTAISLVFSLFQLSPAPFCVLDEVDAPLDDINVGRFCQLVKQMSESTQFIVISHNKVTIEMADHLMGVTMQEPGVSRMVSVDMEEAIAMTEA